MKTIVEYKAGTTAGFLYTWAKASKGSKWTQKMKTRTNKLFQEAILSLKDKDKVLTSFTKSYIEFLTMWKDEKYFIQAHNFAQDNLKTIQNEEVRKQLLNLSKTLSNN